jgi:hypothetical protein
VCSYRALRGLPGAECQLARVLAQPLCSDEPLASQLVAVMTRQIEKARGRLRRAEGRAARAARRLLRAAARDLQVVQAQARRAQRARRITQACQQQIAATVSELRRLVLEAPGAEDS